MKIDFTAELKDVYGKSILWDSSGSEMATLRLVALSSLLATSKREDLETQELKFKRWQLAQQIQASDGVCDLQVEQVVLLKSIIAVVYGTSIMGPAFEAIDPTGANIA